MWRRAARIRAAPAALVAAAAVFVVLAVAVASTSCAALLAGRRLPASVERRAGGPRRCRRRRTTGRAAPGRDRPAAARRAGPRGCALHRDRRPRARQARDEAARKAPAAVVLLEGLGDNVRVEVGDSHGHSPYAAGSRMRLLDDDGDPLGSIAVAARPGRPYDERDERVLDALAQRVGDAAPALVVREGPRPSSARSPTCSARRRTASSRSVPICGCARGTRPWRGSPASREVVAVGRPCCSVFKPVDEEGRALHGWLCPVAPWVRQIEVMAQLVGPEGTHGSG